MTTDQELEVYIKMLDDQYRAFLDAAYNGGDIKKPLMRLMNNIQLIALEVGLEL